MKTPTRRQVALALGALLVGGAALTIVGKRGGAGAAPLPAAAAPLAATALTVDLTTPQRMTLPRTVAASGSVGARDELVIGSDAAGVRLLEVHVEIGAVVRRGQLLARGDDAQLLAQAAQLDAQVRDRRIERQQADANLDRAERIRDSGVYSVEAIEARRTAAASAAARLELVQAQRRELEVRLAQTRVLAPADGVISRRSATVGAVVQPGAELFRLIRDEQLEWLAELPAHALGKVAPGAPVLVQLDDGGAVQGSVRLVAPTIDARTRNGVVHVSLPRGTPLRAGAHVHGEIAVASVPMLTLPEPVVLSRDGQPFVYVVDANDVARQVRIETGMRRRGLVEVTAGLEPGARVVAAGAGFVKDGERVRVASQRPEVRS